VASEIAIAVRFASRVASHPTGRDAGVLPKPVAVISNVGVSTVVLLEPSVLWTVGVSAAETGSPSDVDCRGTGPQAEDSARFFL
jgi:hypothetical protein